MKKRISSILSLALVLLMLTALLPQRAEAAGVSFSGAGSLREGERVTVTFSLSGDNVLAVEAYLDYDSSHLTLESVSQEIGGGWVMDSNGSKIVLRDTTLNDPINSGRSLFSATFRVDSGTAAGTSVWASVSNVVVSDGNSDISLGSASWGADILAPLSGNNYLSYITCSNGTLEPAFDPDIREYSMTVPYEVDSLGLDWGRDSGSSWVDVSGNSLSVGSNTVSLTVTAENGNTRTYYIYVTRQEDPNYVPNTDATLSGLSASVGTLSPAFDPTKQDYVVYVPYEVESISVSGTAADAKAKGVAQATNNALQPGENLLEVVCTAEDGTTTQTYRVHVVRMPAYAGTLPTITGIDTAIPAGPAKETAKPADMLEIPLTLTLPLIGEVPTWAAGAVVLVLVLLLLFLLAWFWGRHSGKKKILKQLDNAESAFPEEKFIVKDEDAVEKAADEGALEKETSDQEVPAEKIPAAEEVAAAPEADDAPAQPETAQAPEQEQTPEQEAPMQEVPAEEAPVNKASAEENPAAETPVEEPAQEETPVEETPAQDGSDAEEAAEKVSTQIAEEVSAQLEEKAAAEKEDEKMSLTELLEDIRNM